MKTFRKLFLVLLLAAFASPAFAQASADGTRIGPPAIFTDDKAATWSLDSAGWVVRNSVRTTAHANALLWYAGKVWAKSPNAAGHWWSYVAAATPFWKDSGTANDPIPDQSSAAGTRVPDAASFKDKAGAVWSLGGNLGDASRPILKDGLQYFGGLAIQIEWLDGNVYAFIPGGVWFQANPTGWSVLPTDPNAAHNGVTVDFTVTPGVVAPSGQGI